jgi:hypothetical protein
MHGAGLRVVHIYHRGACGVCVYWWVFDVQVYDPPKLVVQNRSDIEGCSRYSSISVHNLLSPLFPHCIVGIKLCIGVRW